MIEVLALNMNQATETMSKLGIPRNQWHYVTKPQDLRGPYTTSFNLYQDNNS